MSDNPVAYLDKVGLPNSILGGVWAVTHIDYGDQLDSVHPTEIEALRVVVNRGHGGVIFIRWGEELSDAEAREKKERSTNE